MVYLGTVIPESAKEPYGGESKMSTDWNQDSLEFILDHIRDAPEKQIQAIDTLDTKMIQIVRVWFT